MNKHFVDFIHFAIRKCDGKEIGHESIRQQFGKTEPLAYDKLAQLLIDLLALVMNRRKELGCRKKITIPPSLTF